MARFDVSRYLPAAKVSQSATPDTDWGEDRSRRQIGDLNSYAERAAIVEYDGKIPAQWSDGYARLLVMSCPENVKPDRWQRFVNDCGRFLDLWAENAGSLGWQAHDLFAVAGGESFSRVDLAGLLWLLDGVEIVALTNDAATVRTKSGATQTYRRVGPKPGQQMAWELRR